MTSERKEVVCLLVDHEKGELQIMLPAPGSLEKIGPRSEDRILFKMKLSDLLSEMPSRSALMLGARSLAALSHVGIPAAGHRGYKLLSEDSESMLAKEVYSRAAGGNPDDIFQLALEKMFEATNDGNDNALQMAEELFRKSASLGSARATRFLAELWPAEKQFRQDLISRRSRRS